MTGRGCRGEPYISGVWPFTTFRDCACTRDKGCERTGCCAAGTVYALPLTSDTDTQLYSLPSETTPAESESSLNNSDHLTAPPRSVRSLVPGEPARTEVLLDQGNLCVDRLTYTIAQTNDVFTDLCTDWCVEDGQRAEPCCSELRQSAMTTSDFPSTSGALAATPKKSLYTDLVAVYNISLQYSDRVLAAETEAFHTACSYDEMPCRSCSIVPETSMQPDTRHFCAWRGLLVTYEDLLQGLQQMLFSLHGDVPKMDVITNDTLHDVTADQAITIMMLAAAGEQLTKAKEIMENSVLTQL